LTIATSFYNLPQENNLKFPKAPGSFFNQPTKAGLRIV